MDVCCDARDHVKLADLGHWLKGSAGMVGFEEFAGPAGHLEDLAREQKWSEIESVLAELRSLTERIEMPGTSSGIGTTHREVQ